MESIITKEEYLKALSIVEKYHSLTMSKVQKMKEEIENTEKTPIKDWDKWELLPKRMKNAFRNMSDVYVEDLNAEILSMMGGLGAKTIQEFIKLRGY